MGNSRRYRKTKKDRKVRLTEGKSLGSLGIMRKKSEGAGKSEGEKTNRQEDGKGLEEGKVDSSGQTLVPQPHGGALSAGNLGNKGGGRTPEEIKGSFRKLIAEKGLPWAERMLDAPKTVACPKCGTMVQPPAADGVRARLLDTATRMLPQKVEHEGVVVIMDADSLSV